MVVFLDQLFDLLCFFFDLEALKRCKTAKLQVKNGVRLDFVDVEQLHQSGACFVRRRRTADERNHFVQS